MLEKLFGPLISRYDDLFLDFAVVNIGFVEEDEDLSEELLPLFDLFEAFERALAFKPSIECHRLAIEDVSRLKFLFLLNMFPLLLTAGSCCCWTRFSILRGRVKIISFSALTSSTDWRNLSNCSSGDIRPKNCNFASLSP